MSARTEKSRKASWNRKRTTGFIKPHRVSCRQRLRVYRRYMAEMIEEGVKQELARKLGVGDSDECPGCLDSEVGCDLCQEETDGSRNDPEGKAPTAGAGEV